MCVMCVTAIGERYTVGLRDQYNWQDLYFLCVPVNSKLQANRSQASSWKKMKSDLMNL